MCDRKTLEAADGDLNRAAEMLREKGMAAAAKKATREAKEGLVGHYIHTGSKVAALVEVNCETDFVARTDTFQGLCKDLAMQVVAARPQWVRIEDIPAEVIAQEQQTHDAELAGANKPPEVITKILAGKFAKFYEENCLLEQAFIKDENIRIKDMITAAMAKVGENIIVRRFARIEVGG